MSVSFGVSFEVSFEVSFVVSLSGSVEVGDSFLIVISYSVLIFGWYISVGVFGSLTKLFMLVLSLGSILEPSNTGVCCPFFNIVCIAVFKEVLLVSGRIRNSQMFEFFFCFFISIYI